MAVTFWAMNTSYVKHTATAVMPCSLLSTEQKQNRRLTASHFTASHFTPETKNQPFKLETKV